MVALVLLSRGQAAGTGARVERVENCGLLFTDNRAGVNGTDAGYSIPMGGRTLWLFGDVFLQDPVATTKPFAGSLSNCGLLAAAGHGPDPLLRYNFLTDPATGLARQLIPRLPGEDEKVRLWPFGGWYSRAERKVYLYYGRVRVTGGGPLDFRPDGMGLAVADARQPEKLTFTRLKNVDGSLIWWPASRAVFGSAVMEREGWLYVFGYRNRGGRNVATLARVRSDRVADSSAYAYWRGDGWSRDMALVADVEGLSDFPTELSVSYNAYLGGFLAVHSVNLGEKARLSVAKEPWGPYRQIGEIDTRHQPFAKAFCYAGKEHPELAEENGRIVYVTWVDSSRYWLHLLRITLGKEGGNARK